MKQFMKCSLLSLLTLLLSYSAHSALPPLYQSISEMKALLDLPELSEKLGSGRSITGIEQTAEGYKVLAGDCYVSFKINFLPSTMPGPARFKFNFLNSSCE